MNNSEFFGSPEVNEDTVFPDSGNYKKEDNSKQVVKNKETTMARFMPKKKDIFGGDSSFRLAIISSSGSGKSVLINEMMTNPSFGLVQKFLPDRIYIFSATANKLDSAYDKIFENLKKRSTKDHEFELDTQVFSESLDANLAMIYDTLYEEQVKRKQSKLPLVPALLILDDILGAMNIQSNNSLLGNILTKIRHLNVSIIISVQYLKSFSPQARAQLSSIITFSIALAPEVQKLYQETAGTLTKKQWFEIYQYCTGQPYSYMLVMQSYPQQYKFFRGQDGELDQLQL